MADGEWWGAEDLAARLPDPDADRNLRHPRPDRPRERLREAAARNRKIGSPAAEPVLLQQLDGRTEKEQTLILAARRQLGDGIDAATPRQAEEVTETTSHAVVRAGHAAAMSSGASGAPGNIRIVE